MVSPTHDLDGNLTFNGSWHHFWDNENRLIKSEPHSATNGSLMVEAKYDYKNRRVEKTVKQLSGRSPSYPFDPSGAGTWDTIETRRYIWNDWNIIAEQITDNVQTNSTMNIYAWGLDLSGSLQGAGGVGGLLSDTKVAGSSANVYYTIGDANGNISEYVDQTGAVKAHYEYSATGEETYKFGSMNDDFTHRFSTKPFDQETGLVAYELRYLKPDFAWLSRDPITENGGVNLYGIGGNDLVNKWDKLGLFFRSEYNLVASLFSHDDTNCPEFSRKIVNGEIEYLGGTIEQYRIMFSKDQDYAGGNGRLKDLKVPKLLRIKFANAMVHALNMEPKFYYALWLKFNHWKKEKIVPVEACVCASKKRKDIYHVVEMESPSVNVKGWVKRYDDIAGKKGRKEVTPTLPTWVGPIKESKCLP